MTQDELDFHKNEFLKASLEALKEWEPSLWFQERWEVLQQTNPELFS